MKQITRFKQQVHFPVMVSVALLGVCLSGTAGAEDKTWEVQSGNTLGKIVAEQYPGFANRKAIMQEILKRNPEAFRGQNVDSLIVGKTLKLPAASDIPGLEPLAPAAGGMDAAAQAKMQALETQVTELKDTVALLEEENASLQEMVKGYAEAQPAAPAAPTPPADDGLQAQLETARQELQASQANAKTLEEQLAAAKRDNETLQNDLQQLRATAVVAESKDSASSNLPWVLLGLLALLTLPLIWLLRRKQEQVAPVLASAEKKLADVPPVVASPKPAAEPLVPDEQRPPAVVPAETVAAEDANPDAALKLDIARAYLDLRDSEAAADILQDVLVEGGERQRQEAREILSFIT
jgi:FimV-like protein